MADKLAAFDVDGTVTYLDSFTLFLRYLSTPTEFVAKFYLNIPYFALYGLKLVGRDYVKNRIMESFLAGMPFEEYLEKCQKFSRVFPFILRKDAQLAIENHLKKGDQIAFVSASLEDYLRPFAQSLGIKNVIATQVEVIDGHLTGHMKGQNCRAEIKLKRIRETFGDIEICAAYGDSRGDKEMIEAATKKYYRTLCDEPKNKEEIKRRLYWGGGLKSL